MSLYALWALTTWGTLNNLSLLLLCYHALYHYHPVCIAQIIQLWT